MFNDPMVAKETRESRKPAFTTYKGLKTSDSMEQGPIRLSNLVGLKMAKRKIFPRWRGTTGKVWLS
jgi:hypothetical protein